MFIYVTCWWYPVYVEDLNIIGGCDEDPGLHDRQEGQEQGQLQVQQLTTKWHFVYTRMNNVHIRFLFKRVWAMYI